MHANEVVNTGIAVQAATASRLSAGNQRLLSWSLTSKEIFVLLLSSAGIAIQQRLSGCKHSLGMESWEGAAPGLGYTQIMPCLSQADRAVAQVRPVNFWPADICKHDQQSVSPKELIRSRFGIANPDPLASFMIAIEAIQIIHPYA